MRLAVVLASGAIVAGVAVPAFAGDVRSERGPVQMAAAEETQTSLAQLRGAIEHDPGLSALIERDRARTQALPLPAGPRPEGKQANAPASQRLDRTMTGSALPPGVDPMITGSNR